MIMIISLQPLTASVEAKVRVNVGTIVYYHIIKNSYGVVSEYDTWYKVTDIKYELGRNYIYWENKEGLTGKWQAAQFGNPIVEPGEKWTLINVDFYLKVSSYKSTVSIYKNSGYDTEYDFLLDYKYWIIFDNLPRWGKRFAFWGYAYGDNGTHILKLIHDVTYLDNGIALKMYYEYSYDMDKDGSISDSETYYEEWILTKWNRPFYDALSPILLTIIGIIIILAVIFVIRIFVRKHMKKVEAIWQKTEV